MRPGAVSGDLCVYPDAGAGIDRKYRKQKTAGASFESPGTLLWSRPELAAHVSLTHDVG